ncbi:MAG: sigma-54-dependent Fis family transcriptional regulator [Planctomycetia bacterium]|nr:sigma-54-dependent Fis family transcriptional regulator [Planctomycetia bacterium]
MSHILVVDDEQAVCWALERALGQEGHQVSVASSAEEAFGRATQKRPDAVLLDVRLPGIDGLTALGRLRQLTHEAPVIVITAFGNLDTAVRAVEGGAFDYLTKPFDLSQALDAVGRALQAAGERKSRTEAPPRAAEPNAADMIGNSPAMQLVFKRIALVAPRDACVLITGESGTGKELVARAIHRHGSRRDRPFIPVHIAALNPNLVESELFGHARGAYTGATQSRPGLLSLADGGTVFLDEVADIPLPVQVKLLRVLEQNEIMPVGSNQPQPLNIRILSATHQDLGKLINDGAFRHDLYFRLNVFQIHLPPLRERPQDILQLAEHFLKRFEPRSLPLTTAMAKHLTGLAWRGNVRELRNALEHAAIVARGGALLPEHLPPASPSMQTASPVDQLTTAVKGWVADRIKQTGGQTPANLYQDLLHGVEPPLLDEVMHRVQGNRWVAAQWLGLNRATVRKKLGLYGLTDRYRGGDADEGDD